MHHCTRGSRRFGYSTRSLMCENLSVVVHEEHRPEAVEADVDGQVGHTAESDQQPVKAVADAGMR